MSEREEQIKFLREAMELLRQIAADVEKLSECVAPSNSNLEYHNGPKVVVRK